MGLGACRKKRERRMRTKGVKKGTKGMKGDERGMRRGVVK